MRQLSNFDDPRTPAGKQQVWRLRPSHTFLEAGSVHFTTCVLQEMLREDLKRTKEELYHVESAKLVAEERCQQLEADLQTFKSHVCCAGRR